MRSCCEALGTALEHGRQESRIWGQWAGSLLAPLGQQILKKTKNLFKRWEYQTTYMPPEKPVCRSRNNSQSQTWNNGLVPNWERGTRLCIVSLLI